MDLLVAQMPDPADGRAEWLEAQLLRDRLGDLVAELTAIYPPRSGQADETLDQALGGRLPEVLAGGLAGLPQGLLRKLIVGPAHLFALRQQVIEAGGVYWQRYYTADVVSAADIRRRVFDRLQPRIVTSRRWPATAAVATLVAVLAVGALVRERTGDRHAPAGRGWNRPAALDPAADPAAYLDRLAADADAFLPPPGEPPGLAVRLLEVRQGCSRLVFDRHPLPDPMAAKLRVAAAVWGQRCDEMLQRLEAGVRPETVAGQLMGLLREAAAELRSDRLR